MVPDPPDTPEGSNARGSRPRRKYHHYRPTLHLRHFADDRERVWVYDRQAAFAPVQQRISELGGESYLYAPDVGPDPRDDSTEVWFSDVIDGPAAEPLRKALRNESLIGSERSRLSAFIAAQDMRTPKAKDIILSLFQAGMDREYEAQTSNIPKLREQILESSGVDYPEEELQSYVESYAWQVEKPAWLQFISDNVNRAGERIYHMGWRIVVAPEGHEFLANDLGIVKFFGGFGRPVPYVMGFAAGRDRWLVPLSSQIALALGQDDSGAPVQALPDWLRRLNRQIVADAYRFVYSHTFHDFVVPWF